VGLDAKKAIEQAKRAEESLGHALITGEAIKSQLDQEKQGRLEAEGIAADLQRELSYTSSQVWIKWAKISC
jgi:hypothetical protein